MMFLTQKKSTVVLLCTMLASLLVSPSYATCPYVTCPSGVTCKTFVTECDCINDAVIESVQIINSKAGVLLAAPLENRWEAYWGISTSAEVTYKTPVGAPNGCGDKHFYDMYKSVQWTLTKGDGTAVTLQGATTNTLKNKTLAIPHGTLTAGVTYKLKVVVTDQQDRTVEKSGEFIAVLPADRTCNSAVTCPVADPDPTKCFEHTDQCYCAGDAILEAKTDHPELWYHDPTAALTLTSAATTYKTPDNMHNKPACSNKDFKSYLTYKWEVWNLATSTSVDLSAITTTDATITFVANTFAAGTEYRVNLTVTGFYGYKRTTSFTFAGETKTVECPGPVTPHPAGAWYASTKIRCPCFNHAAVRVLSLTNDAAPFSSILATFAAFKLGVSFQFSTGGETPGMKRICENIDFINWRDELLTATMSLTQITDAPATAVDISAGTTWLKDEVVLTQDKRYTAVVVISNAVGAGFTYTVTNTRTFLADTCTVTCPGGTLCVSSMEKCPCASYAAFIPSNDAKIVGDTFKNIFDRTLAMTITPSGSIQVSTVVTDLDVACKDMSFTDKLITTPTAIWSVTDQDNNPVAVGTENNAKLFELPALSFTAGVTYTVTRKWMLGTTEKASRSLVFKAEDYTHVCPGTGGLWKAGEVIRCPCAIYARLTDTEVKYGINAVPIIMQEDLDFALTASAKMIVPQDIPNEQLVDYAISCKGLVFNLPWTATWSLKDKTENEDVVLPASVVADEHTFTLPAHYLGLTNTYEVTATFATSKLTLPALVTEDSIPISTPVFVAEHFTVTCPGTPARQVGTNSRCPCAKHAVLSNPTIDTVTKVKNIAVDVALVGHATYAVPTGAVGTEIGVNCAVGIDFIGKMGIQWTLNDVTTSQAVSLNGVIANALTLTIPTNKFVAGRHYLATLAVTDVFGNVKTTSVSFQTEPEVFTCPDPQASKVEVKERCPCAEDAQLRDLIITQDGSCAPKPYYAVHGLTLNTDASYKTLSCASDYCDNVDFHGLWKSVAWTVKDDTTNTAFDTTGIATNAAQIVFPENKLTPGHTYTATATYTDLRDRLEMVSRTFEARVCIVRCPDGSCVRFHAQCPCVYQASLHSPTIVPTLPANLNANKVDVTKSFSLASDVTYKTPAVGATCNNVDFYPYWTNVDWTVFDVTVGKSVTLPAGMTINAKTISFAANVFTTGHSYVATVTFRDTMMERTTTQTYAFEVLAATPVISVLTSSVSTVPVNFEIVTSVADPYAGGVATWYCQTESSEVCPAALTTRLTTGTRNGLIVPGPVPKGTYQLWMKFRDVQGAYIPVVVKCNADEMLLDGACPSDCTYTCPDGSCASKLGSCECTLAATITNAAVTVWPAQNTDSTAMTFDATAKYRQETETGTCLTFDFNPYMSIEWQVFKGTSTTPEALPTLVKNKKTLQIPDNTLEEGATYTVSAVFSDMNGKWGNSASHTFTVKTFTPFVSVTGKGSVIVTSATNINVSAVVSYKHADGTVGTWSCKTAANTACPASVTEALNTNGTNKGLFISGPVAAGTYKLVLTYKGVASSPLTLQVTDVEVPRVSILASSGIDKQTYIASQTLSLGASVSFVNKTTLAWTVNGLSYGTKEFVSLSANALLKHTTAKPRTNTIRVRATYVEDTSVYSEATLEVRVVATPTLSLVSKANVNSPGLALLALSDAVSIVYEVADAPEQQTIAYEVGYVVGGVKTVAVRTASLTATFVTPMVPSGTTLLDLFVDARINGVLVASLALEHAVRLPDPCAVLASQIEAASSTDEKTKLAAVVNLGYLTVDCPTDAGQSATLDNVVALEGDVAALNALEQVLSTMTSGGTVSDAAVEAKSTNYLTAAAPSVGKEDGATFVNALAKLNASATLNTALETVGTNIATGAAFGETVSVASSDKTTIVSGTKLTGAAAADLSVSNSNSSISGNVAAAGIAADAVVTVTSTVRSSNAYGVSEDGETPSSVIVSYTVGVDGETREIKDLEEPLYITFESTAGAGAVCQYYDTPSGTWSRNGTWLYAFNATTVTCASTHLTTFTTFGSSAATIVASLFAVVVAAMMQLWAQ